MAHKNSHKTWKRCRNIFSLSMALDVTCNTWQEIARPTPNSSLVITSSIRHFCWRNRIVNPRKKKFSPDVQSCLGSSQLLGCFKYSQLNLWAVSLPAHRSFWHSAQLLEGVTMQASLPGSMSMYWVKKERYWTFPSHSVPLFLSE